MKTKLFLTAFFACIASMNLSFSQESYDVFNDNETVSNQASQPERVGAVVLNCVNGDCTNGWGKYQFENGYYEGFWVNGKRNGYGLYLWPNIGKYIGTWQDDEMTGYGEYIADDGDQMLGQFVNGTLNGRGYTTEADVWSQGIYTRGTLTTPLAFEANGNTTGCTAGDCQNGYGQMSWTTGDFYSGFFSNGVMSMGIYEFSNGDKYFGGFNNQSEMEGLGRYYFADGSYYGGDWYKGQQQGKGIYIPADDSERQIGEWKNGSLVRKMGN